MTIERSSGPTAAPTRRWFGRQGRESGRGQALTEFALVMPIFVLMLAGMADFGMGVYADMTVINAAREGARLGAVDPGNTSAVEARVRAMATNLDQGRLAVSVTCQRPSGSSFTSCSGTPWQTGDATVVRVDYRYSMMFPLLFGTEIPMQSEVSMRIEGV
jgi:Flp pilus assembly protein TadG